MPNLSSQPTPIEEPQKTIGLNLSDIITLPAPLPRLLRWMIAQETVSLAAVVQFLKKDESQAQDLLNDLIHRGYVNEFEVEGTHYFKVHLAPKAKRSMPDDIWKVLESNSATANVFISYSRRNKPPVQRLHKALRQQGREVWVDWESIPSATDWRQEIKVGIEVADAFISIVSPASVHSDECNHELEYAIKHNKRLIPIIYEEVSPHEVHPELARLNWIYMRESDDFETALRQLGRTLDTDLEYVRDHTRLLMRALEWEKKGRDESFLLRGNDLKDAEEWLEKTPNKDPRLTDLHTEYINTSRTVEAAHKILLDAGHKANRMIRWGIAVMGVTFVLAISAAVSANLKVQEAERIVATATNEGQKARQATTLERSGIAAIRQFQFQELEALLLATRAGIQLQTLVRDDAVDSYPAFSPLLALQTILSNIREKEQFQSWINNNNFVQFSADGERFIITSAEDVIDIRELSSGRSLRKIRGSIAQFSPTGEHLVTVSQDNVLRVFNHEGQERSQIQHPEAVKTLLFSPDGRFFVTVPTAENGVVRLWNRETLEATALTRKPGWVRHVQFSPNGQYLAIATSLGNVTIRYPSGRLFSYEQPGEITTVRFSPDGQHWLTASADGTLRLWRFSGGTPARFNYPIRLTDAQFSPDGQMIAVASEDGIVRLLTLQGELLADLQNQGIVTSIQFHPNGQALITASTSGLARLWSLTGQPLQVFRHQGEVTAIDFSRDGEMLATASKEGTTRLWYLSGHQESAIQEQGMINGIQISPDGEWMAIALTPPNSGNSIIRLRRVGGGVVEDFAGDTAQFSPDSRFLAIASNRGPGRLVALNGTKTELLREFNGVSVQFSPNSQMLAIASPDNRLQLIDINGDPVANLRHPNNIRTIQFNAEGQKILTASLDGIVRLWELSDQPPIEFKGEGRIVTAQFSPNFQTIATGDENGRINLWQLSGKPVSDSSGQPIFFDHRRWITALQFSPKGDLLASASRDGTARLWQIAPTHQAHLELSQPIETIEPLAHQRAVRDMQFTNDGQRLVTASEDGTIRIWTGSGNQIAEYSGIAMQLIPAQASDRPNSGQAIQAQSATQELVIVSTDNTIQRWSMDGLDQLVARGCAWLQSYLANSPDIEESDRRLCGRRNDE